MFPSPRIGFRTAAAASLGIAIALAAMLAPCGAATPKAIAPAPTIASAPVLFQRIVLLGASATAGFERSEPLGGPKSAQFRFADFVEAVCASPHEPVAMQATHLVFLNPEEVMEHQVAATVAAKPTLVLGLDALFWSCYGANLSPTQRLERFEAGLRRLEKIEAPLLLADLPDASAAIGLILNRAQVPDRAVITKCNERLAQWAAGRAKVAIFPLARLMGEAHANREVSLAGLTWAAGKSGELIRPDRLHPSRRGLAALAVGMLDAAAAAFDPAAATLLKRDPESVLASAAARTRAAERPAAGKE
jgi:hypothetical protein